MSGNFDIDGTESSTLVNTQSTDEQDTTKTTGEEDKTDTADPSGDNYYSADEEDNEDTDEEDNDDDYEGDNNDENSVEGEAEEGIQDSTKQNDQPDEYIKKDQKDKNISEVADDKVVSDGTKNNPEEDQADVNTVHNENADNFDNIIPTENTQPEEDSASKDEKVPSDGTNNNPEEDQADVNTVRNENPDNSDDIIPTKNTQPEEDCASITLSQIRMAESETAKEKTDTESLQSTAIDSTDITDTQINDDGNKTTMKWRLEMGGPALMKRRLQVKMQDISTDSDKGLKSPDTKEMKGGNKSVMRKLMCMKCPEMFFMMEGYQRHLFKDHKVRCFQKHLPQVIEKIVTRYSQETYKTSYRLVKSKDSDNADKPVKNTGKRSQKTDMAAEENAKRSVEEDDNVQTKPAEETKSDENDENTENTDVSMKGKSKKPRRGRKCKGKKSHMTSRKKKTLTDKGNEEESESYRKLRLAMQKMYEFNKEEPTEKCIGCENYFYSEEGMQTHFQHVHTNMNDIGISVNKEPGISAPLMDVSTVANVEVTEGSELPNIIEPTQTATRGRKRSRNDYDANVRNKKCSRGSPSPSKRIGQTDNKKKGTDTNPVRTNLPEVNLRRKISEISDDHTPTSKHFTRSHKTDIETNDHDVTNATMKQSKRKASSKDFQTKPVPEKKRKHEVDADEIIKTHSKKGRDDHDKHTEQTTTDISKKSDRKKYATQSKGNLECHDDATNENVCKADTSQGITKDGKKSKSAQMKMDKTEHRSRKSSETSDDHVQSSTSKSKEKNAAKNKRGTRHKSETSDDSAQVSISTSNKSSASKTQRRTRNKSGHSDDTAQPSTSSGIVAAQSAAGRTTHSKSKKSPDNDKSMSNDVQNTETLASAQDGFGCYICQQMFRNYNELKIHKVKCMKNPKKHFCEVCGKGFHARTLMQQHYDFRHTNKPKKFVCTECNKAFELKKSYDKHMMWLHNKGDYKFQCDFCGRHFFHLQEFKVHHAKHTNIKEYSCGHCNNAAFATPGKLNAHLANCGKPSTYKCTICHKFYSTSSNLAIHVGDVHKNDVTWRCPICPNKVYGSQGGYYHHLQYAHKIGRKGDKLEDYCGNCGKPSTYECTICHKFYSTSSNLAIHVGDVHKNDVTWRCPICPNKVYGSQGGYYHHLQYAHKIGRNGDKLEDYCGNCGKPSTYKCTICHKFYSTSSNLAIHVGDVHKNDVTWRCPICPNKVYGSQGGYYHHL